MSDDLIRLAYDIKMRRAADPELATGMGAEAWAAMEFPRETWISVMSHDMRVYEITLDQLQELVAQAKA